MLMGQKSTQLKRLPLQTHTLQHYLLSMQWDNTLPCMCNRCVFCWRHHKTSIERENEDRRWIVQKSLSKKWFMHTLARLVEWKLYTQSMGAAHQVRHCTLSLIGQYASREDNHCVLSNERAMPFWFGQLYLYFSNWNSVQVQIVPCLQFKWRVCDCYLVDKLDDVNVRLFLWWLFDKHFGFDECNLLIPHTSAWYHTFTSCFS
jgi:hypothetical protein